MIAPRARFPRLPTVVALVAALAGCAGANMPPGTLVATNATSPDAAPNAAAPNAAPNAAPKPEPASATPAATAANAKPAEPGLMAPTLPAAPAPAKKLTPEEANAQCWMKYEGGRTEKSLDARLKLVERCYNEKMGLAPPSPAPAEKPKHRAKRAAKKTDAKADAKTDAKADAPGDRPKADAKPQ